MLEANPAVHPELNLESVVRSVCNLNHAVTVTADNGDSVKIIPVPKPVEYFKGRPVYRLEDAKYLYLDCPWLLE
ncbi:MAG: hypothetical protein WCT04_03460 [Planctomycetota bacterium]